jgi:hypothetical protein
MNDSEQSARVPEEHRERQRQAQARRDDIDAALVAVGLDPAHLAAMRPYFDRHHALTQIPTQRPKRTILLDLLAQQFTPGQLYSESRVNLILGRFNPDWAALRRYLVDDGFLDRREGYYWRSGGTFDMPASREVATG